MTNKKSNTRKKSASRKKKSGKQTHYKYIYAAIAIGVIVCYSMVMLHYFIQPYTLRWKALYGEVRYPEGYSIHGIDVSHHQGEIDWEKVADARINDGPISFVFIKATEGQSLLDANFNENFYQAQQYGLIRGAYHYFTPSVKGRLQAEYYLHQVHLVDGDLPPVLDIEEKGNLTIEQLRHEALTWLRIVEERYEVPPIIYTGLKFKEANFSTPEFDRYPFWIAHYYVSEVGYKGEWRFWQHTDLGHIDGIKGAVDLDIYNGSMYDLRHFLIGKDEPPIDTSEQEPSPDDSNT